MEKVLHKTLRAVLALVAAVAALAPPERSPPMRILALGWCMGITCLLSPWDRTL